MLVSKISAKQNKKRWYIRRKIIGAFKIRNNDGAIQSSIFKLLQEQFWTFLYCFLIVKLWLLIFFASFLYFSFYCSSNSVLALVITLFTLKGDIKVLLYFWILPLRLKKSTNYSNSWESKKLYREYCKKEAMNWFTKR